MKLFFLLFTFLCFTHTQATAVNKDKLVELGNCKTYKFDATGKITECTTCYDGFTLKSGKCAFVPQKESNADKPKYPSYNCQEDGTCQFYEIKYDGANGVCSKKIDLVDYNGATTSAGYSCEACAKFNANNDCEECATGYLLKGNKCVSMDGVKLFPEGEPANEYCVHGEYSGTTAQCFTCTGDYYYDDYKCIKGDSTIAGCIEKYLTNEKKYVCNKCRDGYVKAGNGCKKLVDHCISGNTEGTCTKCMNGYYLTTENECGKCEIISSIPEQFNGDECNILSEENCAQCNPNCEVDSTKHVCVSKHCDLFDSSNKCIRCEQGYVFYNGKCQLSSNGCKEGKTEQCADGYYKDDTKGCVKCNGKCTSCYSDTVCKDGSSDLGSGYALNGLPCFDANCELCSSENQRVCLRCSSSTLLINGRCYTKYISGYNVNTGSLFTACRYNPATNLNPDLTVKQMSDLLDSSFSREISTAYEHSLNEDGLCEYHDHLPFYYYVDNNAIKCVGENRDENNDCECKEGYYAEDVHKFSDCVKYKDPHCEKPLNADVCGKCKDGLVLKNYGTAANPDLECGCPDGQRVNANGACIDCSSLCATCRTKNDGTEKCLTCKGRGQSGDDNFNRDPEKQCACKNDNFVAYEDESGTVYGCNEKPAGCTNVIVSQYLVRCDDCEHAGFSPASDCTECMSGWRKDGDSCVQCPIFQHEECPPNPENGTTCKVSACASCNETQCLVCNDPNMDPTQDCRKCNKGYSLKFKQIGGGISEPFCVQCHDYCEMEGNLGCYYATVDGCNNKNIKTEGTSSDEKGTIDDPYDSAKIDDGTYSVYCDKCNMDNQHPCSQCDCGTGALRFGTECKTCKSVMGDKPECDLEKEGCKTVIDESGVQRYQCLACSANYNKRTPTNNCTTCSDPKQFPVPPSNGNGGCDSCDEKCGTCEKKGSCLTCKTAYAQPPDCTTCTDGYFVDNTGGSFKCSPCSQHCSKCSGNAMNCLACDAEGIYLPVANKGCSSCSEGYYYDAINNICEDVDSSKGFVESVLVCKLVNGSLVDCRDVVEQKLQGEVESTIERAVKCDTTIKGVAADPVNGYCTCKRGFYDNRKPEEIEADPKPQCTDVRHLTGDDFCIHAEKKADGKFECKQCNAEYLELKDGECVCKDGYYTTSWGSCVPCDRHIPGCKKCKKCEKGKECPDDTKLDCLDP